MAFRMNNNKKKTKGVRDWILTLYGWPYKENIIYRFVRRKHAGKLKKFLILNVTFRLFWPSVKTTLSEKHRGFGGTEKRPSHVAAGIIRRTRLATPVGGIQDGRSEGHGDPSTFPPDAAAWSFIDKNHFKMTTGWRRGRRPIRIDTADSRNTNVDVGVPYWRKSTRFFFYIYIPYDLIIRSSL